MGQSNRMQEGNFLIKAALPPGNKLQCLLQRIHPVLSSRRFVLAPVSPEKLCAAQLHGDKQVAAVVIAQMLIEVREAVLLQPRPDLPGRRLQKVDGDPGEPLGQPSSITKARASVVSPRTWKIPASIRASAIPPSLPLKQMRVFPGYWSSAGRNSSPRNPSVFT